MKAIDFVVRDNAGGIQRGVVSSEAQTHVIQAQAGQEISLNLRQIDLAGQQRVGEDLIVTLTDGRVITIDNYFNSAGAANRLFISADGYLNEVSFVEADGGNLFAQYGPTEQWGKWSPSDDLIYLGRTEVAAAGAEDDEVSMFAAPLLGAGLLGGGGGAAAAAAAVVGGAAVIGGAGGGGGGGRATPPADPFVNNAEGSSSIGGDDRGSDTITVTGGGEPGDTIVVQIGDKTVETTIDDDGKFETVFEGDNFPNDGTYEAVVTVTTTAGEVVLDGPDFVIDTTPPVVAVTSGTGSVNDSFNAESFEDGVTLTGTGEAGATVVVTIAGIAQTTTVSETGTWTATWVAGTLAAGEYTTAVSIVSTDAFNNSTTISDTLVVDTITNVTIDTDSVETDGTVNAEEREDGVTLTGTGQAGSTVVVTFGTGSYQAIVDENGNWAANFAMSEVPTGELTSTVSATATDSFGNTSTTTGEVDIDTLVRDFAFTGTTGGADGVINIEEAAGGFTMTGITEPGSSVSVVINNTIQDAIVAADGTWSVQFSESAIPTGEQTVAMTATSKDAAGNVATISQDVTVDRDAGILTISSTPVEGDNVINFNEASDGVVLNGTSNPNAVVTVTMGGVSHTVNADGAGNWTTTYSNAEITPGVYTADITATTTDSAGNTLNATDSVQVDTQVTNLSIRADTVEGDGVINAAERLEGGGVQVTGTTEIGSTLVVVTLNGVAVNAVIAANGNWTATYASSQVTEGTYNATVSAEATDSAGNSRTVTDSIRVDTEVVPLNMTNGGGGTDGVANFAEAAIGIDLGGQVEAGSTLVVNFDGTNYNAAVDAAGNWSVTIPPSGIRAGTYDAAINITATDAVGNVDTVSDVLPIDTEAPEGPVIASYTRDAGGIRGISTELNVDDLAVLQVGPDGARISGVEASQTDVADPINEMFFSFSEQVPDGSHLVITSTDGAGNIAGTYVPLDDEVAGAETISLNADALSPFNIQTVDLKFVEDGQLTISEEMLLAFSENSNALQINGGADDNVTITGAKFSRTTVRDEQPFNVYTLGDEGTLYIDADISVNGVI